MKVSRNYEMGHELMCQAIVFSRSDNLQIKEQRKKVHRKDARYKEITEEFVLYNCYWNRHTRFLLLWRHVMGLLVNKGTGEDVEGSSHCLIGRTVLIWANNDWAESWKSLVNDSVEIPTRCSFVIEFIIPKFIEGLTCFERHTAHHQEL